MTSILTTTNILFVITILGVIFIIYDRFSKPQIKQDKLDALMKQSLDFLAANFNEKFIRIDKQITNLTDNHIHTLTVGLEGTNKNVNNLAIEVAKLSTIIDERIPRKVS